MTNLLMKPLTALLAPTVFSRLLSSAALILTAAITSGSFAQEYPHAYPREGVSKLIDNDRVIVWDVNWIRGVEQPYHRHLYDMAGVYLRWGPIKVTQLDGSFNPPSDPFAIPRPYFQRAGVTHKEEMIGFAPDAPERWSIMIDLKDVPSKQIKALPNVPVAFPRAGAELAIDNDRVSEWKHGWEAGKALPQVQYVKDAVQVFYEGGRLQFTDAEGNVSTESFVIGDARFIPAGTVVTEMAVNSSPKAVTVEIK